MKCHFQFSLFFGKSLNKKSRILIFRFSDSQEKILDLEIEINKKRRNVLDQVVETTDEDSLKYGDELERRCMMEKDQRVESLSSLIPKPTKRAMLESESKRLGIPIEYVRINIEGKSIAKDRVPSKRVLKPTSEMEMQKKTLESQEKELQKYHMLQKDLWREYGWEVGRRAVARTESRFFNEPDLFQSQRKILALLTSEVYAKSMIGNFIDGWAKRKSDTEEKLIPICLNEKSLKEFRCLQKTHSMYWTNLYRAPIHTQQSVVKGV